MQSTRMLIDSTTVAVAARGHLTLPAALPMLAEAVEEGGFTIGRLPFEALAKDADVVVLPEHREGGNPIALRVPVLRLGEVML